LSDRSSALALNIYSDAARLIQQADALLICAGAGMGVDSGLPDFRGDHGFWKAYPALKQESLTFMDLANPQGFETDAKRAWGFYGHRYHLYNQTMPHDSFRILKKWCSLENNPSFIFTSNVDGHFQKSGFNEAQILECHGSINHLQCAGEFGRPCMGIWPAATDSGLQSLMVDTDTLTVLSQLPQCPHCRGLARPNILMFDDYNWQPERTEAQEERFQHWKDELFISDSHPNKKLLVIEIGAGTEIPSVRLLSGSMNTDIIRINPRESEGTSNVLSIPIVGLEALQDIDKYIRY
jgi:NAD-dependent SIR2 family protein deacetylase